MNNFQKLEELRKSIKKDVSEIKNDYAKMSQIALNGSSIIDDIDKKFELATKLDKRDMGFLFTAVALQCTRIFLQPNINLDFKTIDRNNRHNAKEDGSKEKKECREAANKYNTDKISSKKYPDTAKIFQLPVPYDAMLGTERIIIPGVSKEGKNLSGGNHHSATIGHDPVVGLVVGPINILTRTITFKNPILQTCEVHLTRHTYTNPSKFSSQYVTKDVSKTSLIEMLKETVSEDSKRVPAALARHMLHIKTDKYCRDGLPIPFVSAAKAQELIDSDWNSYELWRLSKFMAKNGGIVAVQAFISILINAIIESAHKFTYQESLGITKDLYSVKTHKILEISNIIASMSNIIYVALNSVISSPAKSLGKLDVGGLLVTIYRIATDREFIREIKMEYIKNEWYDYVIKELEV